MKIKEVCKRTGLTERTIRYYVEEKLVNPKLTVINGREYRNYSEQDVAELLTIANLRKLFFTINEIREMKESPEKIAELVASYRLRVHADAQAKADIVAALDSIDLASITNVETLAHSLKNIAANLQLPKRDVTPSFGRFDRETKEEREQEYQLFLERQARRFKRGKAIVFTIASMEIVMALVTSFMDFNMFSLIISIALAIALYAGVAWVRYLYAISALISIFLGLSLLSMILTEQHDTSVQLLTALFAIILTVYYSVAGFLLLFNNSVKDFLYAQKHG